MERKVLYRDRQELQATDLNNTQTWQNEASQHLVMDAITSERQYTGLTVTQRSASEIDIAKGRLYDGTTGQIYYLSDTETVSVFSLIPTQDQKWLAVSVYGQSEDVDIQARDFLIDLQTGQTQPEEVAMENRQVIISNITQGEESATPQKPSAPTGYTLIAHVRLSTSGIQEIILATTYNLPNLQNVAAQVASHDGWILSAGTRIDHLASDLAGLGNALASRASIELAMQLARDMAGVKERLEIPDDKVGYGADHFLNDDESDTGDGAYSARTDEGLRPPLAASDTVSLSLLNPVDPAADVSASGHVLPAYNEITRLRLETKTGETNISSYQYQTTQLVQKTMSRERIQYGQTRTYCTNSLFWRSSTYDPTTGILRRADGETWVVSEEDRAAALINHRHVRVTQFWKTTYTESYWDVDTTTHTLNGSVLAQTVLIAQTGFLTSIDLYFTAVDASGGLTLSLVDASRGEPDLNKAIAKLDLASSALSEGWTTITLATPLFVQAGSRYAIVLSTGSQHKVGYTEGTEYTQGVMMYLQDGQFLHESSERDLMMRLKFAQFTTPRAIIQMQPLQLAGGIADLDMLYEGIVPDGCELSWEYQVGGAWYPVAEKTADNLASLPALVPFRAVFVGTTDLMPIVRLTDSQIIVARQATSFTHLSTTRTLGSTSSDVRVRLLLEGYDGGVDHTVDCALVISGSPVSATSYNDEIVDSHSMWREFRFALGTPTSDYVIKITGSTTDWQAPFHVAERYDLAL